MDSTIDISVAENAFTFWGNILTIIVGINRIVSTARKIPIDGMSRHLYQRPDKNKLQPTIQNTPTKQDLNYRLDQFLSWRYGYVRQTSNIDVVMS